MAPNIFGRPDNSINDDPVTTSAPNAPNVLVAYPSFDDWVGLYDFRGTLSGGEAQNRVRYDDMRRSHERAILEQLTLISRKDTGRAVLVEIMLAPLVSVMIFPYDFMPLSDMTLDTGALTVARSSKASWMKDVPISGQSYAGKPFVATDRQTGRPKVGTGAGTGSDIFFTPRRYHKDEADDVFLHELVHASRNSHGVKYTMPVSGGYGNLEEFLAETVTNMYRSEKKKALLDYNNRPIKAAGFLDTHLRPTPRLLLGYMKSKQPKLFKSLAEIDVPFNPMKQVDTEGEALIRRIER